ncbi:MAG: PAS domain S-box protein [Armatimonadetes bacterium]|nr:PAS domain S-box protein [Armatimonadota bacterium]
MPDGRPDVSQHEHPRLIALAADVGHALTTRHALADMLRGCAEALVRHLDAALARIWTLDQDALVLRASAGPCIPPNDPHGPVPVGQPGIGLIAQQRRPHRTNTVTGDPCFPDQEWAAREGVVAFAGYPLVVEDRLVGVAALFALGPLSQVALQASESVADQIAVGIERIRAGEALRASEERYRAAFAHAAVGMTLADLHDRCLEANAAFCALTGYSEEELLHRDFPSLTHPDDLAESLAQMARLRAGEVASVVMEKRYVRKDGRVVWVQNSVALVHDAEGSAASTIALTEDISGRKRAEAERAEAAARQRAFARDVLASVTEGRLILCAGEGELPAPLTHAAPPLALTATEGLSELRHAAMAAARGAGHAEDRVGDLVIAASEAGMNAIVHAGAGTANVSVGELGTVQVRVADRGGGITLENLPKATLARGFSTKATLGHGIKMMLETADRLYLLTGPGGTTVVLEQERDRPLPAWR